MTQLKFLAVPVYGLAAYAAGMAIGHQTSIPDPSKCHTVILDEVDLALRRLDYSPLETGGQWSTAPDPDGNFQVLGYAMNEDSIVYNHLECIYTMPEYPAP